MLERVAASAFLIAAASVAYTGRVFPDMLIPSAALIVVGSLLIVGLRIPRVAALARPLGYAVSGFSAAAVGLTLLAATIGGSFHISPETQPMTWSLAGVAISGALLALSRRGASD